MADKQVTDPKFSKFDAPQTGGVSSLDSSLQPGNDIFDTNGSQPIRDREADPSKGTPVARFFTKDGTPVEPSTIPTGVTPSNLAGPDASMRDDVVQAFEYIDEGGNTVTHDNLASKREADKASA